MANYYALFLFLAKYTDANDPYPRRIPISYFYYNGFILIYFF